MLVPVSPSNGPWLSHTLATFPPFWMYIQLIVTSRTPASTSRRASSRLSPYSFRPYRSRVSAVSRSSRNARFALGDVSMLKPCAR